MPNAIKTFFASHTFCVWNQEPMKKYFQNHCNYEMKSNFISIEGLLQSQGCHIAGYLRTATETPEELEEMIQLICSSQSILSFSAKEGELSDTLVAMAEMSASATNMLAHVLMAAVQMLHPTLQHFSNWVCIQLEYLQLQMKIDPPSLLILESQPNVTRYGNLINKVKMPEFHDHKALEIGQAIMKGRKSNREQFLLGTESELFCDYMSAINSELNEQEVYT
ncbi:MAG: hypothetical protein GY738_14170, partial [Pseudoalteromonas sp.]|nr:hypothetical protein [Pseudoalteromonas sp.]